MPENKVAPIYQKKQATAQQAEAVVDALIKVFDQPLFNWERPRVMVDTWEHGRTVVWWERGPHGWMWVFPCGGMLGGTLWEIPEAELPKGVCIEPCGGCVVSVYQEVAERQSAEIGGKPFASSASSAWVPWFALLVMFERTPLGNCWTSERPPNATVKRGTKSATSALHPRTSTSVLPMPAQDRCGRPKRAAQPAQERHCSAGGDVPATK